MTPTLKALRIHEIDRKMQARFETLRLDAHQGRTGDPAAARPHTPFAATGGVGSIAIDMRLRRANDLAPRHLARIGEG